MLIAVDPGVHACGVAWFNADGALVRCEYTDTPLDVTYATEVTCEIPQVYAGDGAKKAAALIDLAVAAGCMVGQLRHVTTFVRPASWKGQVPKDIHHARVRVVLTPIENQLVSDCAVSRTKLHNVLDAIALGLKTLGRM